MHQFQLKSRAAANNNSDNLDNVEPEEHHAAKITSVHIKFNKLLNFIITARPRHKLTHGC